MKRILVVLIALASTTLQAQITIHPKGGITMSNIAYSDAIKNSLEAIGSGIETKYNLGYIGGVGVNVPIGEGMFSIQPEVLYLLKGYRLTGTLVDDETETTYDVESKVANSYIELPILAKVSFGSDELKFFVNAGPYIGYWLSSKSKTTFSGNGQSSSSTDKATFSDSNNRLDYGIQAGAGVGVLLGPGMVTLEGRYGYGLANTFKNDQLSTSDAKSQNRFIMVMVGYAFPLGGN